MAGEGGTEHISTATDVLLRADAALATPPAATREAEPLPQGAAKPMSDEMESCFRVWWKDRFGSPYFGAIPLVACIEWTRFALARWGGAAVPLKAPPTDDDIEDLAEVYDDYTVPAIRRALELWGGAAVPVPVPVSERPWEQPGWCDAEGYCWAGYPSKTENLCTSHPQWLLTNPTYIDSRKDSSADSVVLLPHWALPVPAAAGEVQP